MTQARSAKKTTNTAALALSAALAWAPVAHAAVWNSSNVQLLSGDGYELGEEKRTILTYENALGWAYGDSFIFIDVTEPTSEGTTYYSEWSPRFSFGKIAGKDLSFGIVKDVMLATTLEMGNGVSATLIGIGLPLDLPGFAFANVNVYARDSQRDFAAEQTESGGQVTLTWKRPFAIGPTNWSFEGFMDYAFGEDGGSNPKEDNIVAAPRLLLDVGSLWGKPGVLEAGIEQQVWRNKFGIDGIDEDVTQAMVKWIF
ncbi:MAG TPA: DUF5020 domain-containing protein [Gammaproteobacteria bacterium]|nr:DUF5020 domain-containing protein [Gammaproteobacteria bacterium]